MKELCEFSAVQIFLATGTAKNVIVGILVVIFLILTAGLVLTEQKRRAKAKEQAEERRRKRRENLRKETERRKAAFQAQENKKSAAEEEFSQDIFGAEKSEEKAPDEVSPLDILTEPNSVAEEPEREKEKMPSSRWMLAGAGSVLVVILALLFFWKPNVEPATAENSGSTMEESETGESGAGESSLSAGVQPEFMQNLKEMENGFATQPGAVASTQPENWGMSWEIFAGDEAVTGYQRTDAIEFQGPSQYFALPGIPTFRGDPYRSGSSYGHAALTEKQISGPIWEQTSDSLTTSDGDGAWTGSGWTGQPLIVKWDADTRRIMNLYEEKKNKENLIEVIYATLGGKIYFIDLEDGQYTRDPLDIGMAFKGAGALDPRGYPLMYVGSGDYTVDGTNPRMFVISLIDGEVLYTYGNDDPLAMRSWCAFDSSPLVDAETDTLIWPGENGIFYTIKLNTVYDKAAGTISISPEHAARTRYASARSNSDTYWLGYESSVSVMDHYAYLSENGGMFYCIDLNTMELIWAQDTKDDSNSSPVAEYDPDTGKGYLYTAPSLHWTAEEGYGSIPIYKLDALTGEIIWKKEYDCATVDGVSGGVQATPVLGKQGSNIENLVIYPIARTPDPWSGLMVAFNKETGEEVWSWEMDYYAWSSPVAVYAADGTGYLVCFDSEGGGYLLDGATGAVLDEIDVGSGVEATPAVYDNTIVIGTRGQKIYGFQLK